MSAKEIVMTNDALGSLSVIEGRISQIIVGMAAIIAGNRRDEPDLIEITEADMVQAGEYAMQGMDFAMLKVTFSG